ncbi:MULTISPECIES: LPS assembly protein LptD [Vibrio]|uniref:LPS-assembly protein LptD n=1 Tax=Vibrio natriegens NBRC 15636 = ATCC 14048 = DSM 759 TaxID=1219067 RepID=A0AAN0Y096_VIBNA|nr:MULTISPECIES: LPS assembly protein LptD [Vibrio]ALR16584.1 LPS biosynthesis protein [Vibrio natriegens NBRC 15636 = ATCC 14048 = DSM 759]ANQ11550.1 LPS assembly protein LptD [Vibrio natriegens NBRC 15636 = ATCC 14048 = DSM 759]AXT69793.1 LPS assembly protein LptD [Vibrio sp. dhg]EPM39108.1 LPS-assembly protein LptD [Vibrio natriegens NBRC 15636 = ATCC 14048 = DSM 759]MDX6025888.1 LPS assembly protein LptD [Vibrio natriegens NBRC 15636 = ATCC 14048 = DSM 759]
MQHFSRTFLAASISTALFVPTTQADANIHDSVQEMPTTDQCLVETSGEQDALNAPVVVEADRLQAISGDKAQYSGNVQVTQGQKKITADSVTLHQQDNVVVAEGNVTFNDGQVEARSDRVTSDIDQDTFSLENTDYHFICQQGRGTAAYIARTGQSIYELEDGSITSCPQGDNSWRLVASGIDVDQDEETATLHHPRFEVLDVPIFYVPYLTMPIGNTRKSGLLFPSLSYGSSDGMEVEVPFYWNIAPQYDMTLTTLYMQQRGTKFDTDFRYLTDGWGEGEIKGEYLNSDRKYADETRWGYQFKHEGIIDKHWVVDVDYSEVSDIDYFLDLDSDIGNREDGQLMQEGEVQYRSDFWDASLSVRDFQVLLQEENKPYRLMPQLALNYYTPVWGNYLNFDVKSQLSRFDTSDNAKPDATRFHIEPGFTIPLSNSWSAWTTEARVLATYYSQDLNGLTDSDLELQLDEKVSRVIPEFRSNAQIYLERDTSWVEGYTQTLEPQVQYLYVPKEDQTNIYNYDTTLLQTDYYGLFRSRKYSSIDKIASANQLSYGASTRFFDDDYKERLNISFGQIYYFDKKTKLSNNPTDPDETTNYSSWAIEADFNYNDSVFYHGGIQYDIDLGSMQLANSTLEYQFDGGFIQSNYRYVTREYIEDTIILENLDTITRKGISQAGIVAAYEFNQNWSASGQYYYDLNENNDLEWLAGLRYQSDCWYIGLTYSNQLLGWEDQIIGGSGASAEYESNFSVSVGIQGFATNQTNGTAAKELEGSDNTIKYGRPFYLNN